MGGGSVDVIRFHYVSLRASAVVVLVALSAAIDVPMHYYVASTSLVLLLVRRTYSSFSTVGVATSCVCF